MPNIFERAMMYNVQTNDILKKYKSLSDDEKKFITKHPVTSYQFYNNSKKAESAASKFEGLTNGYGDAHENKPNNSAKRMNLHNNSVGYSLGIKAIENEWSDEELLKNVIKAADDGILQIGL